jgi:hypothetical protein
MQAFFSTSSSYLLGSEQFQKNKDILPHKGKKGNAMSYRTIAFPLSYKPKYN